MTTRKTTPEPTPALDAEKVRKLIDEIVDDAYNWGFHSAVNSHGRHSLDHLKMRQCYTARAALEKMLGIEEG